MMAGLFLQQTRHAQHARLHAWCCRRMPDQARAHTMCRVTGCCRLVWRHTLAVRRGSAAVHIGLPLP